MLLKLLRRALFYFSKICSGRFLNCRLFFRNSAKTLSLAELKNGINFIDPWFHPKPRLAVTSREAEQIRALFQPRKEINREVTCWLQSQLNTYRSGNLQIPVLGVHARRGDYKRFRGGELYFSDLQYLLIIQNCVKAIYSRLGVKPFVVVCSDEQGFSCGTSVSRSPFTSPTHDQELLSQVDFIAGPPSTFSKWAAFMGQNKIALIREPDKPVVFDDFKEVEAHQTKWDQVLE